MRAQVFEELGRRADAAKEYRLALDCAKRTSQKELKFSPPELREILLAIRRLEAPSPGR
jgi:hypothetical protein